MFSFLQRALGITALDEKLEYIIHTQGTLLRKGNAMATDLDGVRTDINTIKQNELEETAAIEALVERLGNNPTADEIASIRTDLQAVSANQGANTAAIASLDPDVPTGSITPPSDIPG